MSNFGFPQNVVQIAQQGCLAGDIYAVSIYGVNAHNQIEDESMLSFDDLTHDDTVTVDTSGGRSMIEALSVKFAHAVAYSIATMQRKGLRLEYAFQFRAGRNDRATMARYGLQPNDHLNFAPGIQLRQVMSVRPGRDKGIRYTHSTAFRSR